MANLSPQERMRRGPELSAAVSAVAAAIDRVAELRALEQRIGNGKRGRPRKTPDWSASFPYVDRQLFQTRKGLFEVITAPKRRVRPKRIPNLPAGAFLTPSGEVYLPKRRGRPPKQ